MVEMQYHSDTEYSEDSGMEDEEEEDDASVCSGSTISAGGQSCTVSDLLGNGLDDAYSEGKHTPTQLPGSALCSGYHARLQILQAVAISTHTYVLWSCVHMVYYIELH